MRIPLVFQGSSASPFVASSSVTHFLFKLSQSSCGLCLGVSLFAPLDLVGCTPFGALPVSCVFFGVPPVDGALPLFSPSHCASGATSMPGSGGFPVGGADRSR